MNRSLVVSYVTDILDLNFWSSATYGELNKGMDYFEGDIKLTQQLRDYIKSTRHGGNLQTRALIKDARKLWPNQVVPYSLADDLSKLVL